MKPSTADQSSRREASLGVYIHVPFCKHECPYCDFYKMEMRTRPASVRLEYPGRLAREWHLLAECHPEILRRRLDTIYLGGGTPSTLTPAGVAGLLHEIRSSFPADGAQPEITLEANPENLVPARCEKWRAAGITRLSIGAQSFDPAELKLLERLHEPATIDAAVRNARAACIDNINLDLMFALPGQSMKAWRENLQRAIELEPDHVSFYGLTYHEGTPFNEWLASGRLAEAGDDEQAAMYLYGAEFLESHGFEHYEISNFARPGRRSRHNERYWKRLDVVGLGPGAHSNLGDARWWNPDNLDAWTERIDQGFPAHAPVEELGGESRLEEALFTGLRRREGISRADHPELYRRCVAWLNHAGKNAVEFMRTDGDAAWLTRAGWLVSNAIIRGILENRESTQKQEQ